MLFPPSISVVQRNFYNHTSSFKMDGDWIWKHNNIFLTLNFTLRTLKHSINLHFAFQGNIYHPQFLFFPLQMYFAGNLIFCLWGNLDIDISRIHLKLTIWIQIFENKFRTFVQLDSSWFVFLFLVERNLKFPKCVNNTHSLFIILYICVWASTRQWYSISKMFKRF